MGGVGVRLSQPAPPLGGGCARSHFVNVRIKLNYGSGGRSGG
eukprot:COSAG02_NODE_67172_length_253_cov_1.298701_1_plen_41_part_10